MGLIVEIIDLVLSSIVSILTVFGVLVWRDRVSRGQLRRAEAEAQNVKAEAVVRESSARLNLDQATRAWAESLIDRYDTEVTELRDEIRRVKSDAATERRELEDKHIAERREWQAEMNQLRVKIADQQREILRLRLLLERAGVETVHTRGDAR
jgi:chromosome segregation ATPase